MNYEKDNYYYYDTTNNTVTPSIGGQSTLNLIHTFANSLNVTGVSSSGGSSSSSSGGSGDVVDVTIEDDDYTDTALRDDIADGFGLLDNNGTEELDDGFLSVAAAFFESIVFVIFFIIPTDLFNKSNLFLNTESIFSSASFILII